MTAASPSLPAGTVTFLFTDIEGSTRLWERDAGRMWPALERHNAILGDAIRAHGGVHFKTVGDAFQAAFASPVAAVAACVDAQRALEAEPWPETGPVRVRMALHLGEAEPSPAGDYLAPSLNRLARLLSAGHGGQVLLSAAVREAVTDRLPEGVSLLSLGVHRLRDLLDEEEIWQLAIPGLPTTFPPLKGLERHPTNLPPQQTPLIGRDEEVAALRDLLDDEGVHVVTLTGPGGVGKTRLALAAAAAALEAFEDGAFLVALAGVEDTDLLLPEIAAVLGVREGGGLTLEESVLTYLNGKRLLLVLDNLEQLRPFEAAAALVARMQTMRVLGTSRAPLRIRSEREWPVSPLPVPEPEEVGAGEEALAALTANPAVALFVDRARAARPAWRLTPGNVRDVAEIARRLDGLPLAIELAAARIRVLTPADVLRRLGDALDLLATRGGDLPDRQQTLRGAIAWSHDLLSFEHQAAFRRLGVFAGGFTLEAAEAVLCEAPDPWVDVLDAVAILVEQSLLRAEEDPAGETRYRMLETVRAFALEELATAREAIALRTELARVGRRLRPRRRQTGARPGRAASGWSGTSRSMTTFARPSPGQSRTTPTSWGCACPNRSGASGRCAGTIAEGRGWLERGLAAGREGPASLRARLLDGLGYLAWKQGDLPAARHAFTESLEFWRSLDDRRSFAGALSNLGVITELQGDVDGAQELYAGGARRGAGDRRSPARGNDAEQPGARGGQQGRPWPRRRAARGERRHQAQGGQPRRAGQQPEQPGHPGGSDGRPRRARSPTWKRPSPSTANSATPPGLPTRSITWPGWSRRQGTSPALPPCTWRRWSCGAISATGSASPTAWTARRARWRGRDARKPGRASLAPPSGCAKCLARRCHPAKGSATRKVSRSPVRHCLTETSPPPGPRGAPSPSMT